MKMKFSLLIILLLTFTCSVFSQNKQGQPLLDSLLYELPKAKEDTNKVNLLSKIAYEYQNLKPSEGVIYAEQGIALAEKLHFKRGLAACWYANGENEYELNNNKKAEEYYLKALSIFEALGDKSNVARTFTCIGLIYYDQSNYPKAMEYHFKSLKINEAIGDKRRVGVNYTNIGNIYYFQENYPKTIECYTKALSLSEALDDKSGVAKNTLNIANVYLRQSNFPKSLEYYAKAYSLFETLGKRGGMATTLMNMGIAYDEQANYPKAFEYYFKALGMFKTMNDEYDLGMICTALGNLYIKMVKDSGIDVAAKKEYKLKAINSLDSAVKIFKSISALNRYHESQGVLSKAYELNEQYDKALIAFKEYSLYKDSVFNEEKTKDITKRELDYTYTKREDSIKLEQQKKDLAHEKELALKAIQFEYQQKQATAKSEKEKQQLRFEQQLKEQKIELEYNQKIAAAETEKKNQQTLNKVLSTENQLMAKNNENERIIRWLMIAALLGLIGFGFNYYRNFQRQRADNKVIVKQSEELQLLMQEIHHRVKNNLQLISSLLELQSIKLTDSAAKSAFEEGQSRVQSIAILHQQLYQHDDLSVIELGTFSKELIRQITDVFKKPKQAIAVYYHIPETFFDIDTALPLGLILNELATNSFKYAHPSTDSNEEKYLSLEISFSKNNDGNYALAYKDNGQGLPAGFDMVNSNSLGLRIINRLVKQIKGQYHYEYNNGAIFTITFPAKL